MAASTTFPFQNISTYGSVVVPPKDFLTPEGKPLGEAPAAKIRNGHCPLLLNFDNIQSRIVDLITRFLYLNSSNDQFACTGKEHLTKTVGRFVESGEQIEFVFPAFPFKSPSRKKVLGSLPDYGEELLLRRLDMLARTVGDYYPAGAVIRILSDGIVYGELLGQSDATVYRYNECLREMAQTFGLTHVTFVRMADLVDPSASLVFHPMTEADYVSSTPAIRSQFLAHTIPGFDLDKALKEDIGFLRTYRGYLKFLETDLEGSPLMQTQDGKPLSGNAQDRERRRIAKAMMVNGAKYSDLAARKFPHAVRLSVHAHSNSGPKFAFDMFPGGDMCASPWHNVIMEKSDGALECRHLRAFDPSTYEIVYREGRPYYLREHSKERDWGEKLNQHVQFHRNYPFGLIVEADEGANLSFNDLPMDKIRALSLRYSAVLFRGFGQVSRDDFRQKSREMGVIAPWPKYGDILELKENPNMDINSSLTCEAMAMHYDGIFKTKVDENGELTHNPPTFQVFQCIHAPEHNEGGLTMLTNSAHLIRYGLTEEQRAWLKARSFSVFTPQNKVFGGEYLKLPIIMENPLTKHDVIRWHEPWPQHITKYKPTDVFINDATSEESMQISNYITDLLYDRRFCFGHRWKTGEFLIADNIEMMHTRTAFKPCPRELWRIHVN